MFLAKYITKHHANDISRLLPTGFSQYSLETTQDPTPVHNPVVGSP